MIRYDALLLLAAVLTATTAMPTHSRPFKYVANSYMVPKNHPRAIVFNHPELI